MIVCRDCLLIWLMVLLKLVTAFVQSIDVLPVPALPCIARPCLTLPCKENVVLIVSSEKKLVTAFVQSIDVALPRLAQPRLSQPRKFMQSAYRSG